MKFWHEETTEGREIFIASNKTVGELMRVYKQPDWCNYPEALSWQMGCWSLCDSETKVSHDFCKTCEECKHYEK